LKFKSKLLTLAIAFCLVFCFAALAFAATDISGHWAQATIEKCLNKGIVAGMPDGTFQPDKNVTRAEFVTMVNKAFGFEDADTDKKFSDVKDSDWYAEQVAIAARAGYVAGMPDGTFQPLRQITRAEASVMVCKAAGLSDGDEEALRVFKDAGNIPAYAKGSISALVSEGLIKGRPDGTFRPLAQITRAESLVMIYNASTGDSGKEEPKPGEVVEVTGVELDKTSVSIKEGETVRLKATVKPENATNKDLEWTTSNEKVATVDDNGLVEGVAKGTATITVTTKDGGKTATCKVEVVRRTSGGGGGGGGGLDIGGGGKKVAVTSVSVEPTSAALEVGQTIQLKATVKPDNAYNKSVTWKSDNESVAKVDTNGLVTAVAEGTATITVVTEDGGYEANCIVTVSAKKVWPEEMEGAPVVVKSSLTNRTYATITIKPDYVNRVKSVKIAGVDAVQQPEKNEWRAVVADGTTVESLIGKIVIELYTGEWPEEMEGAPVVVKSSLTNRTYATITIKPEYVDKIQSVKIAGADAVQQPEKNEWRAVVADGTTVESLIGKIVIAKKQAPPEDELTAEDVINIAKTTAKFEPYFKTTYLMVYLNEGFEVASMKANGEQLSFNAKDGAWETTFNHLNVGDEVEINVNLVGGQSVSYKLTVEEL